VSTSPSHRVEPSWYFEIIGACQRLVGHTLTGRRDDFAAGLAAFSKWFPVVSTHFELQMLRDRVIVTVLRAGHACHEAFHRRSGVMGCGGSPLDSALAAWKGGESDLAKQVRQWSELYLADFDRYHQWPAEWKAVDALEHGFCAPLQLDRLASDVACGRATLIRRFSRTFGLSLRQYHTQLRVRHAVAHLRSPDSNVDSVARLVGYGSTKNLYRAFRTIAGLTPSAVRGMAPEEVDRLLQRLPVLSTTALIRPEAARTPNRGETASCPVGDAHRAGSVAGSARAQKLDRRIVVASCRRNPEAEPSARPTVLVG
jgi:AraC-like DNA-binding protein